MKAPFRILIILTFLTACGSTPEKHAPGNPATVKPISRDTTAPATTTAEPQPKTEYKTHLHDTTDIAGYFILFLLPNDARYRELDSDGEEGASDADADFGVGISNTLDSLKTNPELKAIKGLTSQHRYIKIEDCLGGPIVIDRDTVNYGFIMSAKGKSYVRLYNNVHSGDYLEEIDSYFFNKGI